MNSQIVKLSAAPEVRAIIRAADPTYKKHNAILMQSEKLTLDGTYWDGGTRYTYTAVNMETKAVVTAPQYAPVQYGGPRETPTVQIPEGIAIICTGVFCGKTATATVYINPKNANKLLNASNT